MNATIKSWFARSTLIQGTLNNIALVLIAHTTLVSITRRAKSKKHLSPYNIVFSNEALSYEL